MKTPLNVLILEDSKADAELLIDKLQDSYELHYERVESAQAMEAALAAHNWQIIIADYTMPRFSALDALAIVSEKGLDLPFILIAGSISEEVAVAAMRAGAHDYLIKGKLERLFPVIERELYQAKIRSEHKLTTKALLKSEQQLRQVVKMEAIGNLAAGIAHDFNNLLTIINGRTEMILSRGILDASLRRELELIGKTGARAAALTHQLLVFSRNQIQESKIIDFNAVVCSIGDMIARLITENISITTMLKPDLGKVNADAAQLEQVIINLVVNARDSMPQGGKLTIETANIDLDATYAKDHFPIKPGQYVMLAISDTGCGMDAQVTSRIFEPFYTTKKKGTGLGLSTVYGIVKGSGGAIWVYSEINKGTTFKVFLPRVYETPVVEVETPVSVPSAAHSGDDTILVVEDDEGVRDLVCEILGGNGYTIIAARNGREALNLQNTGPRGIDLLISDIVMPEMSGDELAKRILKLNPKARVLYMSGYTNNALAQQGISNRGIDILEKPFTPQSLINRVQHVLCN